MVFEIISIEAVNVDEYWKARNRGEDVLYLDYDVHCYDLNRFPHNKYLESMLPPGFRMFYYDCPESYYLIELRCLIDGGWVPLRLWKDPCYTAENFHILESGIPELVVLNNIATFEDVARILERYMPELREWRYNSVYSR